MTRDGTLKVKIERGINLVARDRKPPRFHRSSDPYVVLSHGSMRLKSKVVKNNLDPEWNDELTLYIIDPSHPVKLEVFDKDTFTPDDPMGDAEIKIQPLVDAWEKTPKNESNGDRVKVKHPILRDLLESEDNIYIEDGKVIQEIVLTLKNVERGKIKLKLEWTSGGSSRR